MDDLYWEIDDYGCPMREYEIGYWDGYDGYGYSYSNCYCPYCAGWREGFEDFIIDHEMRETYADQT